jgi:hypothetical protein
MMVCLCNKTGCLQSLYNIIVSCYLKSLYRDPIRVEGHWDNVKVEGAMADSERAQQMSVQLDVMVGRLRRTSLRMPRGLNLISILCSLEFYPHVPMPDTALEGTNVVWQLPGRTS